ncbi:MAG: metallophosphoesterase [Lachnospiraceae bacterium]|nr:metallophosphoesterase [Lachnospiraceae bacterium]
MEIFLWIIAICVIIAVGVIAIDSNRFVVREYTVESDKLTRDHDFIYISDLHCKSYGKENSKLLKAVDAISAEAILLGGDMVTSHRGVGTDIPAHFVSELAAKNTVYYSEGNHEQKLKLFTDMFGDTYEKYAEKLSRIPIRILENEKIVLDDIDLYALSIDRDYYERWLKLSLKGEDVKAKLGANDESRFSLLLAHDPEYFKGYAEWKPDLVLSGHNHGGMARLPFVGGIISPRLKLFPHYDGGLFEEYGSKMILSRGIGSHTIPFRFLNPGELIVIHLKKALK